MMSPPAELPVTDEHRQFIEALTASQEALRGYCYSKIRIWADAEDVVQETNVKLWEKVAEWDRSRLFLPWALGIARFTVMSHFRDKGRDRLIFDEDVMEAMERHLQNEAIETPARIAALRTCMAKMDPAPQEALKAHYVSGLSMVELAEATGRSVSGVKSLLMRLRIGLAKCIAREQLNAEGKKSDDGE